MDITDKIVKEWSWRCSKGYPDINNPEDKAILDQLLKEWKVGTPVTTAAPITEDDGEPEVTLDALMDLLKNRRDDLPPEFIKNLYTQVQGKGKGISSKIAEILTEKGIDKSKYLVLSTAQRLNVEEKLLKYLQSEDKPGLEALRAGSGGSLLDFLQKATKLPAGFIESILQYDSASKSKGVGKGEFALALFMKDGAKKQVGDVDVEGKHLEVKADLARLGERHGNLGGLLQTLEDKTKIPKETNLQDYVLKIAKSGVTPEVMTRVRVALNKEFNNSFKDTNLADQQEVRKALFNWYVDSFFATEPSDLILLYLNKNYKLYTPEEFRNAVLAGEITFTGNFTSSNKAPQLKGF